jgi:hypothetical protein
VTRAPRGWPSKKRNRNGENEGRRMNGKDQPVQRPLVRCSVCRGVGHNARNCARSPAQIRGAGRDDTKSLYFKRKVHTGIHYACVVVGSRAYGLLFSLDEWRGIG